MSSHQDWQKEVCSEHMVTKPFAPENGLTLKFKVGDSVVFTNDAGGTFRRQVNGLYQPDVQCSLYARGYRYLLDQDAPWMPVKESSLHLDDAQQ